MTERVRLVADGIEAEVVPYGASLAAVRVPDRRGVMDDIVLPIEALDDPWDVSSNPHLGAMVGRYANRIAGAEVTIDDVTYRLDPNRGTNTLHGGSSGWSRQEWEIIEVADDAVTLRLVSPDGDGGFPGEVVVDVEYRVTPGRLAMTARARTDRATVVSITNHAYWNLAGGRGGWGSICDHEVDVLWDRRLVVDGEQIPTGEVAATADRFVGGTVGGVVLDDCLVAPSVEIGSGASGWDPTAPLGRAAVLSDRASGRRMEVRTNQPGLQVYTGDHLGPPFGPRTAICLEAQQLPDAPHRRGFPSTVVRPDGARSGIAEANWQVEHRFDVGADAAG